MVGNISTAFYAEYLFVNTVFKSELSGWQCGKVRGGEASARPWAVDEPTEALREAQTVRW